MDLKNLTELRYPALFLEGKDGKLDVIFRDIPDANISGVDVEIALASSQKSLITSLIFLAVARKDFPPPSKLKKNEHYIGVSQQFLRNAARYRGENNMLIGM